MSAFPLRLAAHFNNIGCTTDENRTRGDFDGWRRSFPFEELRGLVGRPGGLHPSCAGAGSPDNVACEEQCIALPEPVAVHGCRVLGATEGGAFSEPLILRDAGGGLRPVRVALSDWLAARPSFGEACLAVGSHVHEASGDLRGPRPRLWVSELSVVPPVRCVEVRLPANPSMHVFGIDLLSPFPEA